MITGTILAHNGQCWIADQGLPTGLPPSSSIANLTLAALDQHLVANAALQIYQLRRYTDDILCIDGSDFEGNDFVAAASSWMTGIRLEQTSATCGANSRTHAVFLDLQLSCTTDHKIRFEMHEKVLNQHLYVPWGSAHPLSVRIGVIVSGLIRISRRYSHSSDHSQLVHDASLRFFQRLRDRGYPASAIRTAVARVLHRKPDKLHMRKVHVRLGKHPYARSLAIALRRHTDVLMHEETPAPAFLRNFRRTWKPEQMGGLDGF